MILGIFFMVACILGVVVVVNLRDGSYVRKGRGQWNEDDSGCMFPFVWQGISYNSCTMVQSNTPWCGTSQVGNTLYTKNCPTPAPTPKPTPAPPPVQPACDPDELDKLKDDLDKLKDKLADLEKENDDLKKAHQDCIKDSVACKRDLAKASRCCGDLGKCRDDLAKCPKEMCANGIKSVDDGDALGNSCCPKSCGKCGGIGCGDRPGGAACCDMAIAKQSQCTRPEQTNCWLEPHPWCYMGVMSVKGVKQARGGSCCPKECVECGGIGCQNRPGGRNKCCDDVLNKKPRCKDAFDTECNLKFLTR